jgi:hypothetical protein
VKHCVSPPSWIRLTLPSLIGDFRQSLFLSLGNSEPVAVRLKLPEPELERPRLLISAFVIGDLSHAGDGKRPSDDSLSCSVSNLVHFAVGSSIEAFDERVLVGIPSRCLQCRRALRRLKEAYFE